MDFKNKAYLIAGASSAIGTELIRSLSQEGAEIYAISRQQQTDWPDNIHFLEADVSRPVSNLGGFIPKQLHGLVYCAGSINLKPFSRLTDDDFLNDFLINTLGAVSLTRGALPALKASGSASVVLLSSVAAKVGMPFHTSIGTAKGALQGFALSLAAELAAQHIRVNVVAPSLTDTPLAASLLSSEDKREASAKRHPVGRYGKASDISGAIQFLLDENAGWITGQIFSVDGGMSTLKLF